MHVLLYLLVFVLGGTLGFVLACVLAAGATKESSPGDSQVQETRGLFLD
jgi:hypothetical protein